MNERSLLLNAPPRLSDLHGDDRTLALRARYEAATEAWLRPYAAPRLSRLSRLLGVIARPFGDHPFRGERG